MMEKKIGDNARRKLLILTLGVGSVVKIPRAGEEAVPGDTRREQIIWTVDNEKYPYIPTVYRTESNGMTKDSPKEAFVASPIVKDFCPDEVIIIGTVKSAWATFLARFHRKDLTKDHLIDVLCDIDEIMENNGIDTSGDKLYECQCSLQELVAGNIDIDIFPELHIVITRYGTNDEQLEENYYKIKRVLADRLDHKQGYDIAFDITHSFRSMPIYNLVVINYLRHIEGYDIDITNVYYGNIDVKSETGGIAPLVDLASITNILDLTNGVTEFKRTGNAATLLTILPETSKLHGLLKDFDQAVQLNDFDWIIRSVRSLSDYFSYTDSVPEHLSPAGGKAPIEDVERIIRDTIECSILHNRPIEDFRDVEKDYRLQRDLRYYIACWLKAQNRYGQACLVGTEALKSMLIPYYLKSKNIEPDVARCSSDNSRKASLDALRKVLAFWEEYADRLPEKYKEYLEVLKQVRADIKYAKAVRNMFAHILVNKKRGIGTLDDKFKVVDNYFHSIDKLYKIITTDEERFVNLYLMNQEAVNFKNLPEKAVKHKTEKVGQSKLSTGIGIIVTNEGCSDADACEFRRFRDAYDKVRALGIDIAVVPQELRRYVLGNNGSDKSVRNVAAVLSGYMSENYDISKCRLFFDRTIKFSQKAAALEVFSKIGICKYYDCTGTGAWKGAYEYKGKSKEFTVELTEELKAIEHDLHLCIVKKS